MGSVELVGRVLVSLVVVLAIVWVLGKKLRRGGKRNGVDLIDVLSRQQLSRTASVAVVRVGSQALIVGITDAQVSVLGETDLAAALAEAAVPAPAEAAVRHRRSERTAMARPLGDVPVADPASGAPRARSRSAARGVTPTAGQGPLAGSALSPQTWRQTIESLRNLTSH
jgi:flagellar protein FliO/FliZ